MQYAMRNIQFSVSSRQCLHGSILCDISNVFYRGSNIPWDVYNIHVGNVLWDVSGGQYLENRVYPMGCVRWTISSGIYCMGCIQADNIHLD